MVGSAVPLGALLGLHGNVSPAMVAAGTVITACKEYPHVGYLPRARELHAILAASARSGAIPRTTWVAFG